MSTAWTPALDVPQGAALRLAKVVEEVSGGRFRIEVFPGGQIMPPLDCFDAASKGTIEAFMAAAYYWTAKEPAVEGVTPLPFAMNLVPRPGPAAAPQMAGWFRKKINTIGDYKGLKMRIGTGLGGKVIAKAGGTVVLTPGSEIYATLERGVIDAAEMGGPQSDMK